MNQASLQPKISFVIPAFNEAKNLPGCLKSILDEVKKEKASAEIIVVNNASTDETKQVVQGFFGVRLVDEYKKGITFARQAGYLASQGELIANIDADNRLPSGWLKKVLVEFAKHASLICLSGPPLYYDLPWFKRLVVWFYVRVVYLAYLFNHFVLRLGSVVQGGNFVVTRKALEQIGGFDTAIKFYGEDTDLARRLSHLGLVKFYLKLQIYSSGRRLAKEGVLLTGFRYVLNYYSVLLRHKPATESYKDIRN
jgi:glycosyltransferase involved in cell wall biosynthesis